MLFPFSHAFPHIPHALALAGCEAFVADIGGVVHEVMNGVQARRIGTGILAVRTSISRDRLLGCICNVVSGVVGRAGLALKGMQEAIPMSDLVDGGPASVVEIQGTARHRLGQNVTAILDIIGRGAACIHTRVWKCAKALHARGEIVRYAGSTVSGASSLPRARLQICLEENIEGAVAAFTQSLLHCNIISVARPVIINMAGDTLQFILDRGILVGVLQNRKLKVF